ncbi:MAG: hypothetical protein AAF630_00100 [Cyanobacteria bacterium P01_C01_bin.38]
MNNNQDISILFDDSSPHLLETGISQTLEQYDSLLLKLFQHLRTAGMVLTLEQYELSQKAVANGFGLGGWNDLKRLCCLLWVKPSLNYDIDVFDKAFDEFRHEYHINTTVRASKNISSTPETTTQETQTEEKPISNLPQSVPRRNFDNPPPPQPDEVATAIKGSSTSPNFHDDNKNDSDNKQLKVVLNPKDFPIQLQDVQRIWRLLKKPVRIGWDDELDVEATIERIEREGMLADVVMRPRMSRKAELLLLIDDNSVMVPFFAAFEPWIQAIKENRITPAKIYRFTSYPDDYLYEWERPTSAHHLNEIIPKLHRNRTITLIISDAGAATITYNPERIEGIFELLKALSPSIRQLIWLNPLPKERWEYTSAWGIHGILDGEMLRYEAASLQNKAQENLRGEIQICPIHPHQ